MKTGLVLEGGAMRGLYTTGVLDVFMDEGITFPGVIGVSAGAIHGTTYVCGQRGRNIRYYLKYAGHKEFMSLYSLVTTGDIVGEQFCYHTLPKVLDPLDYEAFRKSDVEFYVVCTNVRTGKAEYFRCNDMDIDMEYLRASASMPLLTKIVRHGGKKLLDGGTADSIPIMAFREMGYEKNVVVLTQPEGYRKKKPSPMMDLAMAARYRNYPAFCQTQKERYLKYNETLDELKRQEEAGETFVIRPHEKLQIGRSEMDKEKIRKVYEMGVEDARAAMPALKKFLGIE